MIFFVFKLSLPLWYPWKPRYIYLASFLCFIVISELLASNHLSQTHAHAHKKTSNAFVNPRRIVAGFYTPISRLNLATTPLRRNGGGFPCLFFFWHTPRITNRTVHQSINLSTHTSYFFSFLSAFFLSSHRQTTPYRLHAFFFHSHISLSHLLSGAIELVNLCF